MARNRAIVEFEGWVDERIADPSDSMAEPSRDLLKKLRRCNIRMKDNARKSMNDQFGLGLSDEATYADFATAYEARGKSSFKNFLAQEAKKQSAQTLERDAIRDEWIKTVDSLLDQIEHMLKEADEAGYLHFERTAHKIRESRLGSYTISGLRITLGRKEINVIPVARYSIASMVGDAYGTSIKHGRVDITAVGRRYMLYRQASADGRFNWIIVDDENYIGRPFDQSSLLNAIQSLLE